MPKNIFSSAEVKVPNRSGFDKSFKNILTTKVGTITPLVSRFIIPNSDINLSLAISACLPPLASDTFMRCSLKTEAFFVPMRLLYGGFESWLTGKELYDSSGNVVRAKLPNLSFFYNYADYFKPGSLADYLGLAVDPTTFEPGEGQEDPPIYVANIFKFLAYHKCYDDWYRNRKIQKPVFTTPVGTSPGASHNQVLSQLPYRSFDTIRSFSIVSTFYDGVHLGDLRQRNYGDDYFTSGMPSPQFGSEQKVTIDSSDQFTISSLRAANSLQIFAERNNLGSPALHDYVKVNYGASLNSGVAQRCVLLGSASYDVYTKGVESNSGVTATNNPFTSVGARYGQAYASGSDFIVKAHFDEPGYLMVMVTLVPEANYSGGVTQDNLWFRYDGSQTDIPVASLENVGNEPIYGVELSGDVSQDQFNSPEPFAYCPRYTAHKTAVNQVHGLLRDGQSLQSFVAQRSFVHHPTLGNQFLQIKTTDLDQVTAVDDEISDYGCWVDSYVKLFVSEPLSESALPSLQDPAYEHGRTVSIQRNGSRI